MEVKTEIETDPSLKRRNRFASELLRIEYYQVIRAVITFKLNPPPEAK